jgi:hypothetical protein
MRLLRGVLLALAGILPSAAMAQFIPASATIYLQGERGDWVSDGLPSLEVTWTQGSFGVISTAIHNWHQAAYVTVFGPQTSYAFGFAAPTNDPNGGTFVGSPPTVGYYANATRWPFQQYYEPGLSATGGGRGVNTSRGWFEILEIGFNAEHTEITSLAVNFQQWDTTLGFRDLSLYGSIRINSSIPIDLRPVPEPHALLMMGVGALLVLLRGARTVGAVPRT